METRIIDTGTLNPISQHDLSIIQGELRDIKELLSAILAELHLPSPGPITGIRRTDGTVWRPTEDSQDKKGP